MNKLTLKGTFGKVKAKTLALRATMVATIALAMMSPAAMAAGRIIEEQLQYGDRAVGYGKLLVLGTLGVMGLVVIGLCGWAAFRDYVLKSGHEQKFSLGALVFGLAIGALLVYPAGALIIGSDLTGGGTEAAVNVGDFDTK